MLKEGVVYLVGAGPGDQRLITVKGLSALKKAEVILYDRLVNPLLLQEAKPDAELIYCGKLPDRHILRQEAINDLLVEKAKLGKVVVRLKGGDPSVFGRVGEEAEALKKENIRYEIVPGITSGIATASYAGIPVTHREYGTSFTVVTGHDKSADGKPLINWPALATGIDTIAFYMGIKNLPYICEQLISNGRSPEAKVAVIQWGTTGKQKVVEGSLTSIESEVAKHNISNPAITLVGNIASLRKKLQWFENKLLFGKKIIFPDSDASQREELLNNGAEVLEYPKLVVQSETENQTYLEKLKNLKNYNEVFFSSKESVPLFFDSLLNNGIDIRSLTAQLLAKDSETVEALKNKGLFAEQATVTSLCNSSLIVGSLEEFNNDKNKHDYLITHDFQTSHPATIAFQRAVEEGGFNTIIFSSPKSVKVFIENVKKDGYDPYELIRNCQVICFGENTLLEAKKNKVVVDLYTDRNAFEDFEQLLMQHEKVI
ncbi:uroporphyrinogen-III C-methyltransferase [Anaerobacillus arseniciselenatis]|uniref:Uroporphyrinogen-III C-methyltransferase n=1 Tax=Anaerobacillus arseniciselenatis TaxID=85682 RepID=A0A1S2LT76_9BACI|nr:uroporphyrinogen-III C-methyltransferase [Anaerobacillus arseniciselenatis]OIJ15718.1 uroporphyrinogen-III C-methyltransferase [Anaerobacillus arseniciselenatis]